MATVEALTDAASAMRAAAGGAGADIRWVSPATYHVTLKFIGWTRPNAVVAIRDALGKAFDGQAAFEFTTRGVGSFPKNTKARVIWAGVRDPSSGLTALAKAADESLAALGIDEESKAFHPHVTLGRVRKVADVDNVLLPWSEQMFSKTRVDAVTLYKSIIKANGSEYEMLANFGLEGASKREKRQTESLKQRSHEGDDGAKTHASDPRNDHTGEHAHGDPESE
jgi:2'-5' RNA ligase